MNISAAVLREKAKPFTVEKLDIDGPRPDEILVRIAGAGLCHTDLLIRDNPIVLPWVLGHEGSGIVEKTGDRITKVKPGDHVVLTFYYCGECSNCKKGHPSYCTRSIGGTFSGKRADGTTTLRKGEEKVHGNFFAQSSFATYAIANEKNVVKVRNDVPIELLGPLGCGIQTGAGAVLNSLKAEAGSSIAIFGLGSVGLSAVMAAKSAGCSRIIGIDLNTSRLEIAKELGATHVIAADGTNPVNDIKLITDGGADYALDNTANPKIVRQAVECMHRLGKCGLLGGSPFGTELTLDMNSILYGRTVTGIIEGDSIPDIFIPKLINMFMNGNFPFDRLITFYPLDRINKAAEDSEKGITIKPVIRFD